MTRRSEWFVPRRPKSRSALAALDYLISFALPRFSDQRLEHSRKRFHYPGGESWIAKLDTVVHELYHIDPLSTGMRQMVSDDGSHAQRCHSPAFFSAWRSSCGSISRRIPIPAMYEFLRYDFDGSPRATAA